MSPSVGYTFAHDGYVRIYSNTEGHACYGHIMIGSHNISASAKNIETIFVFVRKGTKFYYTTTNVEYAFAEVIELDC